MANILTFCIVIQLAGVTRFVGGESAGSTLSRQIHFATLLVAQAGWRLEIPESLDAWWWSVPGSVRALAALAVIAAIAYSGFRYKLAPWFGICSAMVLVCGAFATFCTRNWFFVFVASCLALAGIGHWFQYTTFASRYLQTVGSMVIGRRPIDAQVQPKARDGAETGYVSRQLWFWARLGSGLLGGAIGAYVGSKVSFTTLGEDQDLRYGAAVFCSLIGWIVIPLLAISVGWLVRVVDSARSYLWPDALVVRVLFALGALFGLVAAVPLFAILTETDHPGGVSAFGVVVFNTWFLSRWEPKSRNIMINSFFFPKSYWY